MATPYSKIFNLFLNNKISDTFLVSLDKEDVEEILKNLLVSAIVRFRKCKKDLNNRNDELGEFNIDLSDDEIEILACLMVLSWLEPQINSIELLKQTLSTKDYKLYSQANHLKELLELRKENSIEVDRLIKNYINENTSLDDLRG